MMGSKKRFPSGDYYGDSDTSDDEIREITPPSKLEDSKHIAPESSTMSMSRKKRKATQANYMGLSPKMIWSESDELRILKGIVDYRNETGLDYISDSGAFFDYLKDGIISSNFSKVQLLCKIRKLKTKFRDNSAKNPRFTKSHDSKKFDLYMAIWGKDKPECVDVNMSKVQAFVQQEAGTNGELNGSAKDDSCDVKFPYEKVDKYVEKEAGEKESEEDEALTNGKPESDDDTLPSDNVDKHMDSETGGKENEEDELCALKDALETTVFKHSSSYAEKMILQKLRTLGGKERKELSDEWKALLVQELQLKSKKQSFAGKLANAALE